MRVHYETTITASEDFSIHTFKIVKPWWVTKRKCLRDNAFLIHNTKDSTIVPIVGFEDRNTLLITLVPQDVYIGNYDEDGDEFK